MAELFCSDKGREEIHIKVYIRKRMHSEEYMRFVQVDYFL